MLSATIFIPLLGALVIALLPRDNAELVRRAAALFSALTMLNGIQPNDEGLMLVAADRIAHGQVPYSDFWWFYPPGQPYLLAGLWKLFGPSLLTWRIVRVLTNAAVVLLAYLLARRQASRGLSLVAAAIAARTRLAVPTGTVLLSTTTVYLPIA